MFGRGVPRDLYAVLCPGQGDKEESAFLSERLWALARQREWEEAVVDPADKDMLELQALGGVNGH